MTHTITIDEGQRQLVIMALAHLAVGRPGWNTALAEIALLMDNKDNEGRPAMFEKFKESKVYDRQGNSNLPPASV
jgi:hypothetical protein